MPRSPTMVSQPFGKGFDIGRKSRDLGGARESVRRSRPSRRSAIFSPSVELNRKVSCGTNPICRRNRAGSSIREIDDRREGPSPTWDRSGAESGSRVWFSRCRYGPRSLPSIRRDAQSRLPRRLVVLPNCTRHVAELDLAACTRQAAWASPARRSSAARCIISSMRVERSAASLHQVHHPAERDHRPHEHAHVGVEHHEAAERNPAGQQARCRPPRARTRKPKPDQRLRAPA